MKEIENKNIKGMKMINKLGLILISGIKKSVVVILTIFYLTSLVETNFNGNIAYAETKSNTQNFANNYINNSNLYYSSKYSSRYSYSAPTSSEAQGSKSYSGGGVNYSINSENINLFNVETPSISAGCSGISLDFGGFSHLDINKLGKFIQNVTMQAPTFAFEMGMQALCPSCVDLANTLQKSAQMFNNMQLDSCQALNLAGDAASKAIYNSGSNDLKMGRSNSFNDAVIKINENLDSFNHSLKEILGCSMNDESICPESYVLGNSSLIEVVVNDIKKKDRLIFDSLISLFQFNNESTLSSFLSAVLGDVVINGTKGTSRRVIAIKSVYNSLNYESLINRLNYGTDNGVSFELSKKADGEISINNQTSSKSKLVMYRYNTNGQGQSRVFLNPVVNTTSFSFIPSFSYSEKILNKIRVKFYPENRDMELNHNELMFLSSFKTPVYKYLNFASVSQDEVDSFIHKFIILAGPQRTYEFVLLLDAAINKRLNQLHAYLSGANLLDDKTAIAIDSIRKNISALKRESLKSYNVAYDIFDKQISNAKELEKLMVMRKTSLLKINVE